MNKKQHAFAISRAFIRRIQRDHKCTTFAAERGYMIHQNHLSDGTHLHTFETYAARPYVKELMGMNCKLTAVGFPFLQYGDHIKIYMWGDWVRRPIWHLEGVKTTTVRNMTIDKRIKRTGVAFFTIAALADEGVRNA